MKQTLASPGTFLDIGTGVGWLAIEVARIWPQLHVVGIDIWEPSLQLARSNVVDSGMEERVQIRSQNIIELDEPGAFNVVWYPGPFLPLEITTVALEKAYNALTPGGWLIFGLFPERPDALGAALTALRIVRCGGHPWKIPELEEHLRTIGFDDFELFTSKTLLRLAFARRPY